MLAPHQREFHCIIFCDEPIDIASPCVSVSADHCVAIFMHLLRLAKKVSPKIHTRIPRSFKMLAINDSVLRQLWPVSHIKHGIFCREVMANLDPEIYVV